MKVIFKEDVKSKGKRFEVKDIPTGYANFLIKQDKVLPATEENIKLMNDIRDREIDEANDLYHYALCDKELLQGTVYFIKIKAAPNGSPIVPITKQDVCNLINLNTIDTTMIILPNKEKVIKKFGTYGINIKRHKDVNIEITLSIVEE